MRLQVIYFYFRQDHKSATSLSLCLKSLVRFLFSYLTLVYASHCKWHFKENKIYIDWRDPARAKYII